MFGVQTSQRAKDVRRCWEEGEALWLASNRRILYLLVLRLPCEPGS
jgi:hypothetical protein